MTQLDNQVRRLRHAGFKWNRKEKHNDVYLHASTGVEARLPNNHKGGSVCPKRLQQVTAAIAASEAV